MKKLYLISALFALMAALIITACTAALGGSNSGGGGNTSSSGGLVLDPGVYAAANGSDTNSGTNASAPLKTIQLAADKAAILGLTNVYVAGGLYTNGSGLNPASDSAGLWLTNSFIKLSGGYTGGFTARSGMTELDGNGLLQHIIIIGNTVDPVSNISINGFVIRGGNAASGIPYGGGIYAKYLFYSDITNCVISNNTAVNWGGGVCIDSSYYNHISADIIANSGNYGGGLLIYNGSNNVYNCRITGNSSVLGGGMAILCSTFETSLGSVISNTSSGSGGGICFDTSSNCLINSAVLYNKSISGNGGGIFIDNYSFQNTIEGTISSNSADTNSQVGGGIYILSKNTVVSNAVINGNIALYGGGLFIISHNVLITNAMIRANTANIGGGIYTDMGVTNLRIFADISYNTAVNSGGGLYSINSTNLFIQSFINSNAAGGNGGGACCLYGGYNNSIRGMMNGNTSALSCGAFNIYGSINITIEAAVINNSALVGYGGALAVFYTTNLHIINSVLTNNKSAAIRDVIHLENGNGSLMISNCMIGSYTNDISYGIFENTADTTGQIIEGNVFLTNQLQFLYYDYNGNHIVYADDSWTNIDNEAYTGAFEAGGNSVQ